MKRCLGLLEGEHQSWGMVYIRYEYTDRQRKWTTEAWWLFKSKAQHEASASDRRRDQMTGDEMHRYVFVGMRVCLCLMVIIKEGLGGWGGTESRHATSPYPWRCWAGDRQCRCCVPGLCCQRRGVSTRDWTTDTGINSSAAELRADQWKRCSTPFKGCISFRGKAEGALINIPCVKAADMEG